MLAAGGTALMKSGNLTAAVEEATQSVNEWPDMQYRTLGNTGFKGSRLVFGCGAALSHGQANNLLEPAFESGINVFDVGYSAYYRDAERNLAPFIKKHGDDIFLISKATVGDIKATQTVNTAQARQAAAIWTKHMDKSLKELDVVENLIDLLIRERFDRAHEALAEYVVHDFKSTCAPVMRPPRGFSGDGETADFASAPNPGNVFSCLSFHLDLRPSPTLPPLCMRSG